MNTKFFVKHAIVLISSLYAFTLSVACLAHGPDSEKVTVISSHPIVAGLDEALVVTVELAPGMTAKPHRHNAQVFVYMLEGEVVMQLNNGEKTTLKPGNSFYESPDDLHTLTQNVSNSKSAKFLVFLLKKKGVPPVLPLDN